MKKAITYCAKNNTFFECLETNMPHARSKLYKSIYKIVFEYTQSLNKVGKTIGGYSKRKFTKKDEQMLFEDSLNQSVLSVNESEQKEA